MIATEKLRKRPTEKSAAVDSVLTDEELKQKASALIAIFKNSPTCKIATLLSGNEHELNFSLREGRYRPSVNFSDNQEGCTLDAKRSFVTSPETNRVVQVTVSASPYKNSFTYSSLPAFQKEIQTQRNTESAYQNAVGFLKNF